MTKEEAKDFGLSLLQGIAERNNGKYADNVRLAIEALSQPSLPSNLDKAAEVYANQDVVVYATRKKSFKAGANWQKEQDLAEMAQSKSPLSVAYANRCFENGKQAMKEQMLEEAAEGKVIAGKDDSQFIQTIVGDWKQILPERVKLIILPNDE